MIAHLLISILLGIVFLSWLTIDVFEGFSMIVTLLSIPALIIYGILWWTVDKTVASYAGGALFAALVALFLLAWAKGWGVEQDAKQETAQLPDPA